MRAWVALVGLVGCTAEEPPSCTTEQLDGNTRGCYAAQLFAARDSTDLLPTQTEVDRYLHYWQRALDREPLLGADLPQRYRNTQPDGVWLRTSHPSAIDAWSRGEVATGDAALDDVLVELGATRVVVETTEPEAIAVRLAVARWPFGEEQLANALATSQTRLEDPMRQSRGDGTWRWDGDTAHVDFAVGIGDCFPGCTVHRFRIVIPAEGPATVCDAGAESSDPRPLSPTTLPCE